MVAAFVLVLPIDYYHLLPFHHVRQEAIETRLIFALKNKINILYE